MSLSSRSRSTMTCRLGLLAVIICVVLALVAVPLAANGQAAASPRYHRGALSPEDIAKSQAITAAALAATTSTTTPTSAQAISRPPLARLARVLSVLSRNSLNKDVELPLVIALCGAFGLMIVVGLSYCCYRQYRKWEAERDFSNVNPHCDHEPNYAPNDFQLEKRESTRKFYFDAKV